ncbi:MAG: hypothetical protein LR008_01200 [Candidatus Pacebacteria bacterium]|nr:hypothetical protein [Candidatus Paceibacterota bacterium]
MLFIKNIAIFIASLAIITLTGCATYTVPSNQNVHVFAEEQAKQMKLHGGSFIKSALEADLCPGVTVDERIDVEKDAYITNNNGGVRFGISYNGEGDARCE